MVLGVKFMDLFSSAKSLPPMQQMPQMLQPQQSIAGQSQIMPIVGPVIVPARMANLFTKIFEENGVFSIRRDYNGGSATIIVTDQIKAQNLISDFFNAKKKRKSLFKKIFAWTSILALGAGGFHFGTIAFTSVSHLFSGIRHFTTSFIGIKAFFAKIPFIGHKVTGTSLLTRLGLHRKPMQPRTSKGWNGHGWSGGSDLGGKGGGGGSGGFG